MVKWLYMAWNKETKPIPEYVKAKISKALTGRRTRPERLCEVCGKDGVRSGRKYCSKKCYGKANKGKPSKNKGKKYSGQQLKNIQDAAKKRIGNKPWNYGKKFPEYSGENSHLWKGGVTKLNMQIRSLQEYRNWRRQVFERDDYTCQHCWQRGGGSRHGECDFKWAAHQISHSCHNNKCAGKASHL